MLRGKLTGLQRKTTEPIATQAGRTPPPAALRRRRRLGRPGRPGRTPPPRRRGIGRPRRRLGPGPLGVPQEGGGLVRRGPPVVRPPGQDRELSGRRLPGLRRPARPDPARRPASTWTRTGPTTRPPPPPTLCARGRWPSQRSWRIGLELLRPRPADLPGGWVAGDDEFGRCTELRAALRQRRQRTCWTCPATPWCATWPSGRPPARAGGRQRLPAFERVEVGGAAAGGAVAQGEAARRRQGAAGGARCCWRRCRPRTRTAAWGHANVWRSARVARRSRRRGTR